MKAKEIRELTLEEIDRALLDSRKEIFNLRLQFQTGQLENSARIRTLRKDVARLETEKTARRSRDKAGEGMGLGETVINVGTQRMKRNLAFLVLFSTGKFSAVQTACATNLDAFRTAFHGGLDGALHRTTERDTLPFRCKQDARSPCSCHQPPRSSASQRR